MTSRKQAAQLIEVKGKLLTNAAMHNNSCNRHFKNVTDKKPQSDTSLRIQQLCTCQHYVDN